MMTETETTNKQSETVALRGKCIRTARDEFLIQVPVHVLAFNREAIAPRLVHITPKVIWFGSGSTADWDNYALENALYRIVLRMWNQRKRNRVVRHVVPVKPAEDLMNPPKLDVSLVPGRRWDIGVANLNETRDLFGNTSRSIEIELTVEYDLPSFTGTSISELSAAVKRNVRCRKKPGS